MYKIQYEGLLQPSQCNGEGQGKGKRKNNGERVPQLLLDNNCEIHDVQRCPWPGKLAQSDRLQFGLVWYSLEA